MLLLTQAVQSGLGSAARQSDTQLPPSVQPSMHIQVAAEQRSLATLSGDAAQKPASRGGGGPPESRGGGGPPESRGGGGPPESTPGGGIPASSSPMITPVSRPPPPPPPPRPRPQPTALAMAITARPKKSMRIDIEDLSPA